MRFKRYNLMSCQVFVVEFFFWESLRDTRVNNVVRMNRFVEKY